MIKAFLSAAPAAGADINADVANMSIGDAGVAAVLGYAVVFVGLLILMAVIFAFGKMMAGRKSKEPAQSVAVIGNAQPEKTETKANVGICLGNRVCELYNVDDKSAAMIMAIVADETKIPLNELRFISIKEL